MVEEIKIEPVLEEKETSPAESGADKGERRGVLIILGVLIVVLILALGGFSAYDYFSGEEIIDIDYLHTQNYEGDLDEERGYMYGEFSFVFVDGLWWTEIKRGISLLKVPLHFGPREVAEVGWEGTLDDSFGEGEEVYVAIDPEFSNKYYTLAMSELNVNIVQGIKRKPVAVCTTEHDICDGREILNCDDPQGKPVIEIKHGGENKVVLNGTCVLVSGTDEGLVKAADRLILRWYGVME